MTTRIEGNLRTGLTGLRRGVSTGAAEAVGQSYSALARGAADVADLGQRLTLGLMARANERHAREAELGFRRFRTDLLYGEQGLARRQGAEAEGITEEATRALQERMQEIDQNLPNQAVRRAVRDRLSFDIEQTAEVMARYESEKLEQHRVSQVGALYEDRRSTAVQLESERLLPGSELFADEVTERVDLYHSAHPGMSREEAAILAKKHMADDAVKASFRMMDEQGPAAADQVMQLFEAYSDEWDLRQRSAVQNRLVDEVGFGLMDNSISSWSRENEGHSKKQLVEGAEQRFVQRFERQFGGRQPTAEMREEVRRRAGAWDDLIDDEIRQQRQQRRDAHTVDLVDAFTSGTKADVELIYQRARKDAIQAKDAELLASLDKLKGAYDKGGSPFGDGLTEAGAKLWLIPDGQVLDQEKLLAAMPEMDESTWRAWVPKHSPGAKARHLSEDGALKLSNEKSMRDALDRARVAQGRGPFDTEDTEYGRQLAQLTALDEAFVLTNQRKPNPSEMDELVRAMHLSFDDPGRDQAFTGTLGEFLQNPEQLQSDPGTQDYDILLKVLDTVRADSEVQRVLFQTYGTGIYPVFTYQSDDPDQRRQAVELVAGNPDLAEALIKYAIVSNRRSFLGRLGPVTGRRALVGDSK